MAGYSAAPLAKKLGIKAGSIVAIVNEPDHYRGLLAPLPDSVRFVARATASTDLVHLFTARRAELARWLGKLRKTLGPEATVWISWPKKAAKLASEVTEETVRELALPLGFVDVKVCAVDETWSGLKLVVRKALR